MKLILCSLKNIFSNSQCTNAAKLFHLKNRSQTQGEKRKVGEVRNRICLVLRYREHKPSSQCTKQITILTHLVRRCQILPKQKKKKNPTALINCF